MDLAFFLKNEDEFLTKQKFNIKCTVEKGQIYEMHCLHNTPSHILSVKSMILKGNQKIVRKPKHSYTCMLHVKIMRLKWQSNLILYIMLYLYMLYLK